MRHAHIHVTGIVQGVGMRPFVYREAMAHGICGWVLNAGDGVHIEATVVSAAFQGKVPLARHRLVYATLGDLMGGAIHALALKTVTPDEVASR